MTFNHILQLLNITFFGKKVNDFFISTVSETIRNREKYNIVRKDVIHILTEARKGKIDTDNQTELGKAKLPREKIHILLHLLQVTSHTTC